MSKQARQLKARAMISYNDALSILSRDEAFKATVSAMNTLLLEKSVYMPEEFEFQFRQAAERAIRRAKKLTRRKI